MNELDVVKAIRPVVRSLSQDELDSMRAELFGTRTAGFSIGNREDGDGLIDGSIEIGTQLGVASDTLRRRPWLAAAAAVLVVAGTVGVWSATADREPAPSGSAAQPNDTDAPDGPDSSGSTVQSAPIAPTPVTGAEPSVTSVLLDNGSRLARAMELDGRLLVVNASGVAGRAGDLTVALQGAGYQVISPGDAADGVILDESVMYLHDGGPMDIGLLAAGPEVVSRVEQIGEQPTPGISDDMLASVDAVIVVGRDRITSDWGDGSTLFDHAVGVLAVVDATGDAEGPVAYEQRVAELRGFGIDIGTELVATRTVQETMLMPIEGSASPWTYAIAELAGVGGFDSWSPDLVNGPLPVGTTAVLVIGVSSNSPLTAATTTVTQSLPSIPAGSVVCVGAGASLPAAALCAEELGGSIVEAIETTDISFVMPVDPTNPDHIAATARTGAALNLPVRDLDPNLLPSTWTSTLTETTYLVIGSSDAPYASE